MSRKVYEVGKVKFHDPARAMRLVEDKGTGTVIGTIEEPNLPGRLPKTKSSTYAMWTYNLSGDGKWWRHDVHGGIGGKLQIEAPN